MLESFQVNQYLVKAKPGPGSTAGGQGRWAERFKLLVGDTGGERHVSNNTSAFQPARPASNSPTIAQRSSHWALSLYTICVCCIRDCVLIDTILGTRRLLHCPPLYFAIDVGQPMDSLRAPWSAIQHTILVLVFQYRVKANWALPPTPAAARPSDMSLPSGISNQQLWALYTGPVHQPCTPALPSTPAPALVAFPCPPVSPSVNTYIQTEDTVDGDARMHTHTHTHRETD